MTNEEADDLAALRRHLVATGADEMPSVYPVNCEQCGQRILLCLLPGIEGVVVDTRTGLRWLNYGEGAEGNAEGTPRVAYVESIAQYEDARAHCIEQHTRERHGWPDVIEVPK